MQRPRWFSIALLLAALVQLAIGEPLQAAPCARGDAAACCCSAMASHGGKAAAKAKKSCCRKQDPTAPSRDHGRRVPCACAPAPTAPATPPVELPRLDHAAALPAPPPPIARMLHAEIGRALPPPEVHSRAGPPLHLVYCSYLI